MGSFIYSTSQYDDYAKIPSMLKSFQKMSRHQIKTFGALACVPFLIQITNSREAKSQTFKNHLTEFGLISSGENAARHDQPGFPDVSPAGTVAEGAPIIPISAQLKYNIEVVCEYIVKKIPVPLRDFTSEPRLIGNSSNLPFILNVGSLIPAL